VKLVDVRAHAIEEITPTGLRTTSEEYEFEVLIYATGFDAMTGALARMNVSGLGCIDLRDKWVNGPTNYLGFMVAGFPNLFMIHGPGSPSVLAQMIAGAEGQINWLADLLAYIGEHGYERVETTSEWEDTWGQQVRAAADATLYNMAESWYLGANIPGKPRVFMIYTGGLDVYREICAGVTRNGYKGFTFI
jgi:cation diffusion facilitator CzcD-associated flavoprotein CzcO